MVITGTELVFGALAVVGIISIMRSIIWFFKNDRNIIDGFFSASAGFIALGCGVVDLAFASLYWQPQTTHLFVIGVFVLAIATLRSIFGTACLFD